LRIAVAGSEDAPIQVRAAEGPRADDEVVEREGARLFIGPGTWERLAGRTIDAVTERTGRIQFVLRAR
jgi:Fe-S cluster assembly iron-binding protein IscA